MALRDSQAKHAVVEFRQRNLSGRQRFTGDQGGETQTVEMGQAALPARKGRGPIGARHQWQAHGTRQRDYNRGRIDL